MVVCEISSCAGCLTIADSLCTLLETSKNARIYISCRSRDLLGRQAKDASTAQLAETYRLPYKLLAGKDRPTVAVADAKGTLYPAEVLVVSRPLFIQWAWASRSSAWASRAEQSGAVGLRCTCRNQGVLGCVLQASIRVLSGPKAVFDNHNCQSAGDVSLPCRGSFDRICLVSLGLWECHLHRCWAQHHKAIKLRRQA